MLFCYTICFLGKTSSILRTRTIFNLCSFVLFFGPLHGVCVYVRAKSLQSCPAFCNLMDCSPLGSSVHGILQERILEWIAIPFSRVSPQLWDQTWVSCIAGRFFTLWATREAHIILKIYLGWFTGKKTRRNSGTDTNHIKYVLVQRSRTAL